MVSLRYIFAIFLITVFFLISGPTSVLSAEISVLDRKTGLEWQSKGPGKLKWPQAMSYCQNLVLGGKADWRLPNEKALKSAYRIKNNFPDPIGDLYWSSTTAPKKTGLAHNISFFKGNFYSNDKRMAHLVRCVRDSSWSRKKKIMQEVFDKKTKLIWQKWEPGEMNWQEAVDYCRGLSIDGKRGWRLPDRLELESALKIKHRFPNAAISYYWSSSSNIANSKIAWCVYFGKPYVGYYDKSGYTFVRCVRGGKSR